MFESLIQFKTNIHSILFVFIFPLKKIVTFVVGFNLAVGLVLEFTIMYSIVYDTLCTMATWIIVTREKNKQQPMAH